MAFNPCASSMLANKSNRSINPPNSINVLTQDVLRSRGRKGGAKEGQERSKGTRGYQYIQLRTTGVHFLPGTQRQQNVQHHRAVLLAGVAHRLQLVVRTQQQQQRPHEGFVRLPENGWRMVGAWSENGRRMVEAKHRNIETLKH